MAPYHRFQSLASPVPDGTSQMYHRMQQYYISRDGIKDYQRNSRPLLGDGVQQFAPAVGVGMLDSTICDIYLVDVDDYGKLVGRPVMTACVDAFSGLCCGYSLGWEGGTYSLRSLMLNVTADKKEWCKKHGVFIEPQEWDSNKLPGVLVTDMGSEYKGDTFSQICTSFYDTLRFDTKQLNIFCRTSCLLPTYRVYYKGIG